MAKKPSDGAKGRKPIPFDDALRRLVNTPPKPKRAGDKRGGTPKEHRPRKKHS